MRKEITADMYNYNKFPGPQFVFFENQVKCDDYQFTLVDNVKDAFDVTVFNQRFSEILLKYDYIVGDWGNEQLRLRGFYKDRQDIKRLSRISRLEDYLKEYCNYGCAYFILENSQPIELVFEEEMLPKRKRRRKSKSKGADASLKPSTDKGRSKERKSSSQSTKQAKQKLEPTFTSKKRQSSQKSRPRQLAESSKTKSSQGRQAFTIRKKQERKQSDRA
ncbi:YutD family protein [Streptococcus saliviloxodontae]|uniref:Uncharacterized protein YutD n=1 Tax=Streptococcus saliviloxodontae TaxID=1349416 RepID=A0ABS2PJB3_9STRE|nr:YutD family protein [Streptococcus saliviloxodontae]MBM7635444.1 uncharacterized protein YutD [Streptococcus saliviloxodontae]